MKIGIAEIIVICVIALVALGPEKLPIYAKKLGASLKAIEPIVSLKEDVNKSIDDVTKSFKSIGKPAKKEEAKPEVIEAEVTETAAAEVGTQSDAETAEETPSLAETYTGRKAPRRQRPAAKTAGRRSHNA